MDNTIKDAEIIEEKNISNKNNVKKEIDHE